MNVSNKTSIIARDFVQFSRKNIHSYSCNLSDQNCLHNTKTLFQEFNTSNKTKYLLKCGKFSSKISILFLNTVGRRRLSDS